MARTFLILIIGVFLAGALDAAERMPGFIPDMPNLNPTRSDPGYNTPAGRDWIRGEFKRLFPGDHEIDVFLPFIHPTINAPLMDGILLEVPEVLTDSSPLAQWGLLDVTASPFSADPTGKTDSTRVLQAAINFACAHQMVVYFPPGDYLISDTLHADQGMYLHQTKATGLDNFIFPNVLVGSTRDPAKRARLVLKSASPGFDDPENPKPMVRFFAMQFFVNLWPKPATFDRALSAHQASGCYNHVFAGIDMKIEPGNPGAAGVNMRAAEGASIQDVTIDAGDGHSGLLELPGSGASCVKITVIGGRFGVDATVGKYRSSGTQPVPTITALTLRGQRESPIRANPQSTLVLVGAHIESTTQRPFIQMINHMGQPVFFGGQLVMVDSRLERIGGKSEQPLITSPRSVVLQNVYTKGARRVVNEHGSMKESADGWTHYKYLAVSLPPRPRPNQEVPQDFVLREEPILINGTDVGPVFMEDAPESPPADLCSRHIWGPEMPHWDSPGAVNVREAPYFAQGDGIADDTAALQRAIDENEILFVPKGLYNISRTLKLRPNTKMIGAAMHLSLIYSREPGDYFYSDKEARPLVETADDADAETVIAFMGFRINCERPEKTDPAETKHYAVKWQSGEKSIWRFNYVNPQSITEFNPAREEPYEAADITHPAVLITGNGGGRWYNFFYENYWPGHPRGGLTQFRLYPREPVIRIANTREESRFYHFLIQHLPGAQRYHCEIENASSVKIYGIKAEPYANFLGARDSGSIEIMGYGGNIGKSCPDLATLVFDNCEEVTVAGYADNPRGEVIEEYSALLDRRGDQETKLEWFKRPLLYRRSQQADFMSKKINID